MNYREPDVATISWTSTSAKNDYFLITALYLYLVTWRAESVGFRPVFPLFFFPRWFLRESPWDIERREKQNIIMIMRTCCWKSHASAGKREEAPVRETSDTAFALGGTDSTRARHGVRAVWLWDLHGGSRGSMCLFRRFSFAPNLMLSVFFHPKIVFARKTTRTIYLSYHGTAATACYVFIVFARYHLSCSY